VKDGKSITIRMSKGEIWARMLRTPFDQQLAEKEV
jgi:hypothetical protein